MSEILQEYILKFGERPPLIIEFPYESADYEKLIKQAIEKNEKITDDIVSDYIDKNHIKTGIVKDEDESNKSYKVNQIRQLLAEYGAKDEEIENFIEDLQALEKDHDEVVDEEDASDEFDYFTQLDTLGKSEEGKDLIARAPKMNPDELKEAVKRLTRKH